LGGLPVLMISERLLAQGLADVPGERHEWLLGPGVQILQQRNQGWAARTGELSDGRQNQSRFQLPGSQPMRQRPDQILFIHGRAALVAARQYSETTVTSNTLNQTRVGRRRPGAQNAEIEKPGWWPGLSEFE